MYYNISQLITIHLGIPGEASGADDDRVVVERSAPPALLLDTVRLLAPT